MKTSQIALLIAPVVAMAFVALDRWIAKHKDPNPPVTPLKKGSGEDIVSWTLGKISALFRKN